MGFYLVVDVDDVSVEHTAYLDVQMGDMPVMSEGESLEKL